MVSLRLVGSAHLSCRALLNLPPFILGIRHQARPPPPPLLGAGPLKKDFICGFL